MHIVNKIKAVDEITKKSLPKRHLENISCIVLHRIDVGETPEQIAQFFASNPEYTGGGMPYAFVIDRKGDVFQCVPVLRIAPGAKALNRPGIQVALIGDFRKEAPKKEQWEATLQLCAAFHSHAKIVTGHTEDKTLKVSVDNDKVCPGRYFDLDKFRQQLNIRTAAQTVRAMGEFGIAL